MDLTFRPQRGSWYACRLRLDRLLGALGGGNSICAGVYVPHADQVQRPAWG